MSHSKRTEDDKIYNKKTYVKKPKEIFKRIVGLCGSNKPYHKILDIGCANGAFLDFLGHIYPGASLFGWDISKRLLEKAKWNIKKGHFAQKDVSRPLKAKETFDLIVSTGVTGCFDAIEPFLKI